MIEMSTQNSVDEPPAANLFRAEKKLKEYRTIHTGYPIILIRRNQEVGIGDTLYKITRVGAEKDIVSDVKGNVKDVNPYYLKEFVRTPRFSQFDVSLVSIEYEIMVNLRKEWEEKHYSFVNASFECNYFRAAYPGAEPYVEVGGKIKKGDVICIASIMKQKEEIHSDLEGTIAKIYFEDGQKLYKGDKLIGLK